MPHPGELLGGRYRLDDRIASGGMGEVWQATDTVLGRAVAVKTLLADRAGDAGFQRRFRHEARALAALRHPGVVAVYDFGSTEAEDTYLVMARVDGQPLNRILAERGRLTATETMSLVSQAASALAAAHAAGIVHRDVKPGNLLVEPDGTVVLVDFGVARSAHSGTLTGAREVVGTALYIAPEQVTKQEAGPAADVYALGALAFHCLAGHPPFRGQNPIVIALQHLDQDPPPLPADVPPRVGALVRTALAKDPADRFPSAEAMAEAARAAAAALETETGPGPAAAADPTGPETYAAGDDELAKTKTGAPWFGIAGVVPPAAGSEASETIGTPTTSMDATGTDASTAGTGAGKASGNALGTAGADRSTGDPAATRTNDTAIPEAGAAAMVGGAVLGGAGAARSAYGGSNKDGPAASGRPPTPEDPTGRAVGDTAAGTAGQAVGDTAAGAAGQAGGDTAPGAAGQAGGSSASTAVPGGRSGHGTAGAVSGEDSARRRMRRALAVAAVAVLGVAGVLAAADPFGLFGGGGRTDRVVPSAPVSTVPKTVERKDDGGGPDNKADFQESTPKPRRSGTVEPSRTPTRPVESETTATTGPTTAPTTGETSTPEQTPTGEETGEPDEGEAGENENEAGENEAGENEARENEAAG